MENIKSIAEATEGVMEQKICKLCGCIIEGDEHIVEGEYVCEDCYSSDAVVICEECREPIFRENARLTASDDYVCGDCADEHYAVCEDCGELFPIFDLNWAEGAEVYVCDDCLTYRHNFIRCGHCGEIVYADNSYEVYTDEGTSESWCAHCFDYNASYCDECGCYYSDEHVEVEDGICEYCRDHGTQKIGSIDEWKAPSGRCSYGYKPNPCPCETDAEIASGCNIENTLHFGFELEMQNKMSDYYFDFDPDCDFLNESLGFTYCKRDGSLKDGGIELVSHPATFDYLMDKKSDFESVFREMISRKYTSHDNKKCGFHIHISLKPFIEKNEDAVNNLLKIFDNHWSNLVRFSRRNENDEEQMQWAHRYNTEFKPFKSLKDSAKRDCSRYMAVNLQNTHTIEIRLNRGTLKASTFIATLQLVKRICDICITAKSEEEINAITWEDIVGNEYKELTEYVNSRFNLQLPCSSSDNPDDVECHSSFHVGDRVRVTNHDMGFSEQCVNRTGTIQAIVDENGYGLNFGVRFDDWFAAGHDLNHRCESGHGQWVPESCLEHVCEDAESEESGSVENVEVTEYPLFPVGSRVRVTEHAVGFNASFVGAVGTVTVNPHSYSRNGENDIGINFDEAHLGGHVLNGFCEDGHGQWIPRRCLELVDEPVNEPVNEHEPVIVTGSRVRVTHHEQHYFDDSFVGQIGTVVWVSESDSRRIGVAFDEPHRGGHDLVGHCNDGYGQWIHREYLELIDETTETAA